MTQNNDFWRSPVGLIRRRLHNVWLHDVADRLRLRRQSIARCDGLDPRSVEPYPVSGDVTIVQPGESGGRWQAPLLGLLAASILLPLGGLVGYLLAGHWPTTAPPAAPAEAVANDEPRAAPPTLQYRVTFWTIDGRPIPVETAPIIEESNEEARP